MENLVLYHVLYHDRRAEVGPKIPGLAAVHFPVDLTAWRAPTGAACEAKSRSVP